MPKKQEKQFYSKEDLPLQYWWNIQDTGNFIYLIKESNHSEEDQSEELINLYAQINDQILDKYGVSKKYLKYLKKKKKYLIDTNNAIAIGDDYKLWRANRLKREIEGMIKNLEETGGRREDTLINIGKFVYGRAMNPMEITVDQYYSNLDYMNRMVELENKGNNNG